jgi:hypothetical protein
LAVQVFDRAKKPTHRDGHDDDLAADDAAP